jgi:predicted AAA+ superfamily ATPase
MYLRISKPLKNMSFMLLGARGTGKTWFLRSYLENDCIRWINLLRDLEFLKYQTKPHILRHELVESLPSVSGEKCWIVIDEIQKVPALLNEVHDILEDPEFKGKVKFALSGSSARKLNRGSANLLAGRALLNNLFPLCSKEIGKEFSLFEALEWGMLPAITSQADTNVKKEQLYSYVSVYLREEIREEQIVRNLDPFSRFLEVAAQSSGSIINYSRIGNDCSVNSKAVSRYYQILEETLIGFFLLPYHRSIRKQQGKSPKFYFFDVGVMRTLEGSIGYPITSGTYGFGRLFEHFFILEVIKLNEYTRKRYKLFYLITKDGLEIDLILENRERTVLIEIKSQENPRIEDAAHLLRVKTEFRSPELWLVSRINTPRIENGVRFLDWKTALEELFYQG